MAEGSKDQGGTGTADPEEDSPNMIVYRKASLRVLSVRWGKRLCWEAVTRIRAPDSSLVCMNVYLPHTHWFHCQVSGSLFPLSYNKLLSLRDPLPTTVSQHWQTRAQQSFNKFSIPSVDGFGSKRAFGDMCNYHIPIVPSLPLAAVWLERFSSIGG